MYSLGCTLFYLLSGSPPFPGGSILEKLYAHKTRTPPPITAVRTDVPPALAAIIDKMLAKSASKRFATPDTVASALGPFCVPATQPIEIRRRRLRPTYIVAALSLVAFVGLLLWRPWEPVIRPSAIVAVPQWREVFHDSFDGPSLDSAHWTVGRPQVGVEDHQVVLRNRGYLITANEFPHGVSARFGWTWTQGDGIYADTLSIVLRTSGTWPSARPFDARDGILIRFNPYAGDVYMENRSSGKVYATANGLSIPRYTRQSTRVVDDGETIAAYFGDSSKPVVSARVTEGADHHHLAFYNREDVGGVVKESVLDRFVVEIPDQIEPDVKK